MREIFSIDRLIFVLIYVIYYLKFTKYQMHKIKYVVCIGNKGYPASLELKKLYVTLPDAEAESHGLIRVIDESGEDYLYPADFFLPIEVSENLSYSLAHAS